jgi:hypothetical protein
MAIDCLVAPLKSLWWIDDMNTFIMKDQNEFTALSAVAAVRSSFTIRDYLQLARMTFSPSGSEVL